MYKIVVNGNDVLLDPANLEVNEANLNDFLCKFSGIYAYYSARWAECQHNQYIAEDKFDEVYSKTFNIMKQGISDKLAEAKTRAVDEVIKTKKDSRDAKLKSQLLYGYIRALDRCFECALNLGYNIRKEMDKIFPKDIHRTVPFNPEQEIEKMFHSEEEN